MNIVLKSKIEFSFGLYLTLQLVGNLKNLKNIVLPGSCSIIYVVESTTNFKLFTNPHFLEYGEKILKRFEGAWVLVELELVNICIGSCILLILIGIIMSKLGLIGGKV